MRGFGPSSTTHRVRSDRRVSKQEKPDVEETLEQDRTATRKDEHILIAQREDVGFHRTGTLLDGVQFFHDSLPDLDIDAIDTSVQVMGKRVRIPLMVAGMTGGTDKARDINKRLAEQVQGYGCAMGLGSQRAMLEQPALSATYEVRDVAPTMLLFGNIGVIQARDTPTAALREMSERVGADALCVHMNPAQEVVQPEGDRDFRGGLETMGRLQSELPIPIVAKETGCGVSPRTAQRLYDMGIRHVDVSGSGGTSWVAVEMKRARGTKKGLGELLREWGIPTAASVVYARRVGMETIVATGGIQTGLDIARAIALGATIGGMARPVLQALDAKGAQGVWEVLERIERELRAVMLLVGAANVEALRAAPKFLSPELRPWLLGESNDRR
jgi:isopentenyl-diphosphate delta-isomerase